MGGRSRSVFLASLVSAVLLGGVFAVVQAQNAGAPAKATRWSDPATWPNNKVPAAGDKVEIASGKEVILDVSPPALNGVTINGKPAFVYYISPTQINVQAPEDMTTGPVWVQVIRNGKPSEPVRTNLTASAPGFFTYSAAGKNWAVAVHPDDPRHRHLIGKTIHLPLTRRDIPIVGDAVLVDLEFGTGAVKITPAHDFNDYEAGERHHLPRLPILDHQALLDPAGLTAAQVEEDIIAELEEMIAALEKAQKEMEQQQGEPPPPGEPQDQPLIDALAELRMIRSLQMRVNKRTERYSKLIDGEQADDADLLEALGQLAEREAKIFRATKDIAQGKNQ